MFCFVLSYSLLIDLKERDKGILHKILKHRMICDKCSAMCSPLILSLTLALYSAKQKSLFHEPAHVFVSLQDIYRES